MDRKIRSDVSLKPFQIQTLRSKVGGILSKVHFKTGSKVDQGMQVVSLKNRELELRLQNLQLESRIKKFEADALRAKRNLVSWQKTNEALRKQAEEIRVIEKQVKNLSVYSKVEGYYLGEAVKEKEGTQLPEGAELGTIIDLSKMFAILKVEQDEVGLIKEGDPVQIRFHAKPREVMQAEITEVKILGEKGAVKTLIENPGQSLRPGMTGLSIIKTGEESVFHYAIRVLKGFLRLDLFL